MSVDLEKNKTSILEAYKDVISDQTETNWWVEAKPSWCKFFVCTNRSRSDFWEALKCNWIPCFVVYFVIRLLLGYEGHTNTLKVVSKGDGGLQELQEDLVSFK